MEDDFEYISSSVFWSYENPKDQLALRYLLKSNSVVILVNQVQKWIQILDRVQETDDIFGIKTRLWILQNQMFDSNIIERIDLI